MSPAPGPSLARFLTEKPASLRFHAWKAVSRTVYRTSFAQLGDGSVVIAPRLLRGVDRISVGRHSVINPGAWLQCETPGGPLTIGDDVYLGHDVHLHALDPVTVGDGCVLADGVFVASTDHARGADRHHVHPTGPVTIGRGVFLGQRAVVLGGVTIGDGATVGAGAVVTRDVAAGTTVAGVPARPISSGT